MIASPADISKTKLPQKYSQLYGGNFIVLDYKVRNQPLWTTEKTEIEDTSYIDIGYGDSRKGFSGFHRFEVVHNEQNAGEEGVTICYSSISCNPSVNKMPFGNVIFTFHRWYSMCLFRDGIDEVLRR